MKKFVRKINLFFSRSPKKRSEELNPGDIIERREIIRKAVRRTISEYGEALKKLGND